MVAQQVLVLFVLVRIRVGQQKIIRSWADDFFVVIADCWKTLAFAGFFKRA